MTNKMKVIFAIVSTVSALLIVMLSTPFAIDTGSMVLSEVVNALGLHEVPTLFILVVLVLSCLYLYLALGQGSHSVGEKNNGHRHHQ
ncbi:MAG: hypothetical protein H6Q54_1955 [Deltaproteobacteria bacterium]|jgi:type III secretory pathway component EscR|nr:hypothetical protein [Deltaproteobacteria bacterium]